MKIIATTLAAIVALVVQSHAQSNLQEAYLKASNADSLDTFGVSVAIDGDLAVIGAPLERSGLVGGVPDPLDNSETGAGAVYIFRRQAGVWTEEAILKPTVIGAARFGDCVDVDGTRVAIGAPTERSSTATDPTDTGAPFSGAVYVFELIAWTWTQVAYLKSPDPEFNDWYGDSVALDDDRCLC